MLLRLLLLQCQQVPQSLTRHGSSHTCIVQAWAAELQAPTAFLPVLQELHSTPESDVKTVQPDVTKALAAAGKLMAPGPADNSKAPASADKSKVVGQSDKSKTPGQAAGRSKGLPALPKGVAVAAAGAAVGLALQQSGLAGKTIDLRRALIDIGSLRRMLNDLHAWSFRHCQLCNPAAEASNSLRLLVPLPFLYTPLPKFSSTPMSSTRRPFVCQLSRTCFFDTSTAFLLTYCIPQRDCADDWVGQHHCLPVKILVSMATDSYDLASCRCRTPSQKALGPANQEQWAALQTAPCTGEGYAASDMPDLAQAQAAGSDGTIAADSNALDANSSAPDGQGEAQDGSATEGAVLEADPALNIQTESDIVAVLEEAGVSTEEPAVQSDAAEVVPEPIAADAAGAQAEIITSSMAMGEEEAQAVPAAEGAAGVVAAQDNTAVDAAAVDSASNDLQEGQAVLAVSEVVVVVYDDMPATQDEVPFAQVSVPALNPCLFLSRNGSLHSLLCRALDSM